MCLHGVDERFFPPHPRIDVHQCPSTMRHEIYQYTFAACRRCCVTTADPAFDKNRRIPFEIIPRTMLRMLLAFNMHKNEPMNKTTQHPTVLMIDDQELAVEMVGGMLEDQPDITLHSVSDAAEAIHAAAAVKPTVVLVDLRMPLIDGFGIIRQFRQQKEMGEVPIIMLSSEESPELKVKGFLEGANDYLVKWPHKLELVARIRYHSSAYVAHKERDDAFASLQSSRQKLLERTRELADAQAALLQAQKIEAIGKLTGGVAHDFNNVLQIISGNLNLLKFQLDGDGNAQRRVTAALEGVERGASLAARLLAFARRQPLQPVLIDARCLIDSLDELLQETLEDSTEIETSVAGDLWNILADASQLENVILNLAINARDAMDGQGKLAISASNFVLSEAEADAVAWPEMKPGEYVLVVVSDNGPGMPPEVIDRVFEPFFTTKPPGQGNGLGLSMAYGFVKQSGGHIEIDSTLGEGTSVRIFLPRAEGSAGGRQPLPADGLVGGDETILVVEDEPQVRETTVEMLKRLGYRVLQAADAQGGLAVLENAGAIDLLFTDVLMPGPMRSMELVQKAKELCPGLNVLFTSGFIDNGISPDCVLDPEIVLLPKPYDGDALARKIRQVLRAGAAGRRGAINAGS
jgi:signal transduction histidine kinase